MEGLTVWKYNVPIADEFTLDIPDHAQMLTAQVERDEPKLWVLVDPNSKARTRQFRLAGTGHPINESHDELNYIGTFQMYGGDLVLHLFEIL